MDKRNALMGEMRATPRNALMGTIADALGAVDRFANMPDKQDPKRKANALLSFLSSGLGVGDLAATADRISSGHDLTRGKGLATQMLPETAGALMAAGPVAAKYPMAAGKLAMGAMNGGADVAMGAERAAVGWQNALNQPMMTQPSMDKQGLIEQIRAAIGQTNNRHIGLRILPPEQARLVPGNPAPNSFKWVNGEITDRTLPGASAASLGGGTDAEIERAIRNLGVFENGPNGYYSGPKIALVHGAGSRKGEDVGESVIRDAIVKWVADNPRWKE